MGTTYVDYSSKTDAYWNYLQNSTGAHTRPAGDLAAEPVPDDDLVLFVDAYDVLVFPAIANAAKIMAESPSPLLFCAERGIYPEFTGALSNSNFYCNVSTDFLLCFRQVRFSTSAVCATLLCAWKRPVRRAAPSRPPRSPRSS